MATNTLTLPNVADQMNRLIERFMMLQELTRMALENLPANTDSNVSEALLNGMQEILNTDTAVLYRLHESLTSPVAQ